MTVVAYALLLTAIVTIALLAFALATARQTIRDLQTKPFVWQDLALASWADNRRLASSLGKAQRRIHRQRVANAKLTARLADLDQASQSES